MNKSRAFRHILERSAFPSPVPASSPIKLKRTAFRRRISAFQKTPNRNDASPAPDSIIQAARMRSRAGGGAVRARGTRRENSGSAPWKKPFFSTGRFRVFPYPGARRPFFPSPADFAGPAIPVYSPDRDARENPLPRGTGPRRPRTPVTSAAYLREINRIPRTARHFPKGFARISPASTCRAPVGHTWKQ